MPRCQTGKSEQTVMTDEQLIDAFATGIEEKRYTSVALASKRFVIFRVAGHTAWSGVGQPWSYAKLRHVLIRKGQFWLGNDVLRREWQGRVSKKVLTEALRLSEKGNKVYEGALNGKF